MSRRTGAELPETRQWLELAQDAAGIGTFDWDVRTNQARCSARYFRIYGVEPSDRPVIYQDWVERVHPDDRQRASERAARALKAGDEYHSEFRIVWPDGSLHWVKSTGRVFRDEVGNAIRMMGAEVDITQLKKAEAENQAFEARLRQSQKMEALGVLAGGVAHDFNNVLTAIVGYTDLLASELPEDSPQREHLREVMSAAQRAADLVKQILTFSRRSEVEQRPVDIALAVKQGLRLLKATLPSTITLREDIDLDCGAVLADHGQIHQVLLNLATNAYQAMRRSGGTLGVSLGVVEIDADLAGRVDGLPAGSYIRLMVSDSGPGIAPEIRERVFDPFFTTKEPGEGSGLGLSVVHGIVTRLGGAITFETRLGEGTTFLAYLPRTEGSMEVLNGAAHTATRGTERILLVDDEEPLVRLGQQALQALGYQVTGFADSKAAWRAFQAEPGGFDLVLSDVTMPGLTGLQLARLLLEVRADIPIVLTTGFSELVTREEVQKGGIRELIMKPFANAELGSVIRRVLDEKKVTQQTSSAPGPHRDPM